MKSIQEKKLTDKQIEKYRKVLVGIFGSYALVMPKEQIQEYRDKVQRQINTIYHSTIGERN